MALQAHSHPGREVTQKSDVLNSETDGYLGYSYASVSYIPLAWYPGDQFKADEFDETS